MFRCKECSKEYEIKPDYCDCGNDQFEEFEQVQENQKDINNTANLKTEDIQVEQEEKNHVGISQKEKDVLSFIIFISCIILSIITIIFLFNPKETTEKKVQNKEIKTADIPSFDTIWDSSYKQKAPVEVKEETIKQPVVEQKVIPAPQEIKKNEPIKNIQKIISIQQTKPQIKPEFKPTQPEIQPTPQTKPTQQTQTKKPTQTQTPKQTTVSTPLQVPQATTPKQTVSQNQPTNQDLANYKILLRNKIASRINFLNVVGDGSCSVGFKLTSSGALTNKSFLKQSDNDSLNDEVYKAIMQTKSYNPPPTNYNGNILKLTVKIYGGNFEVSLN